MIRQYGALTLSDWSSVILEKELDFDYCENILSLLADKAISVCRSKVLNTYLEAKHPNRRETRLLLYYLFSDDKATDHLEYFKKYAKSDEELRLST